MTKVTDWPYLLKHRRNEGRVAIVKAYTVAGGSMKGTAVLLKICVGTLYKVMKDLEINRQYLIKESNKWRERTLVPRDEIFS